MLTFKCLLCFLTVVFPINGRLSFCSLLAVILCHHRMFVIISGHENTKGLSGVCTSLHQPTHQWTSRFVPMFIRSFSAVCCNQL